MSISIINARVQETPKLGKYPNGNEYVLLNISKRSGKNASGVPIYNNFRVFVVNEFDMELAKSLDKNDYVSVTIVNELLCAYVSKTTGTPHAYMSGTAVMGNLTASYSNHPSQGLFDYEDAQEKRRAQLKQHSVNSQAQSQNITKNAAADELVVRQQASVSTAGTKPIAPAAPVIKQPIVNQTIQQVQQTAAPQPVRPVTHPSTTTFSESQPNIGNFVEIPF